MHKDWCGTACSECQTSCALDESIPCSPDCALLNSDGDPEDLRECLRSGCDAIICIDKIQDAVTAELAAYKAKIISLSSKEVYDKSFDIHLVQEMVYLVCDCKENYEDDEDIIWTLYSLSVKGKFLDEFLNWSYTLDSIDVSNVEKAYDTLRYFCDCLAEESA